MPDAPGDFGPGHRRPEEVTRGDGGRQLVAILAGCGVGGDVHQKFRGPVFGHLVAGPADFLPLALPLQGHCDGVLSERRVRRKGHGGSGGPEGGRRHDPLAERAAFPVLEPDPGRVGPGGNLEDA